MAKRWAILEGSYAVIVVLFLCALHKLNYELLSLAAKTPFELLRYNHYKPLYFFAVSVILSLLGAVLIAYFVHNIRYSELDFSLLLSAFLLIFFNIFLIVLIVIFINNPILRAIILALAAIVGGAGGNDD